jgi:hypothetical protein
MASRDRLNAQTNRSRVCIEIMRAGAVRLPCACAGLKRYIYPIYVVRHNAARSPGVHVEHIAESNDPHTHPRANVRSYINKCRAKCGEKHD